jgi:hypothetical protein
LKRLRITTAVLRPSFVRVLEQDTSNARLTPMHVKVEMIGCCSGLCVVVTLVM